MSTDGIKSDPDNPGWALVWAVVRKTPWHIHSVHRTEEEARHALKSAGDGFEVKYGSIRLGHDDFVST